MADDKATDERRFDFSSTMLAALDEVRSEGFQRKQPTLSEASDHMWSCPFFGAARAGVRSKCEACCTCFGSGEVRYPFW